MITNSKRGQKYFKAVGDKIFSIRIGRVKENEYSAKILNEKNSYIKVTDEILKNEYTLLNPDGYITFSIVSFSNKSQDVIICLHRNTDMAAGALPYAVCRQSAQDVFSQPFVEGSQIMYVGCSMSQDTCPKGIDFKAMTACNSIDSMDSVAIYIDDTLDTIMSLINKKKFDTVLMTSNTQSIKDYNEIYKLCVAKRMAYGPESIDMPPKLIGYVNTLEELLISNSFMHDFYKAFHIIIANFEIKDDMFSKENLSKNIACATYFENVIKHDILNIYLVPFSKEINLREIRRKFLLAVDINDKLWIVAYDLTETNSRSSYETVHEREIFMNLTSKKKIIK